MRTTQSILAIALLLASAMVEAAPTYKLDIEPQPLSKALQQFAAQSGLQVVYYTRIATGRTVSRLTGTLTAAEALERLLANTGLKFQTVDEHTVAIRPTAGAQSTSDLNPAAQMRVARLDSADGLGGSGSDDKDAKNDSQITVQGERDKRKAFTDANRDIPRTINDAQPYYIFDSETIDRSGATNIEDFLKQRLSMNTVGMTNSQNSAIDTSGYTSSGNTSSINLRGVGLDKTLILVNGRRMPGVMLTADGANQPDLNGIPLSAIDRIEVLPSSASGIYGGSAIGGVVNIILKSDYTGGQLRATYDSTWDGNSSSRTLSGSYGMALEGGKTHLSLNAAWSDSNPLLVQDRADIYRRNLADIMSRSPQYVATAFGLSPWWLGSLPNITARNGTAILRLKNNGSPIAMTTPMTYVPAGTSPTTSMAQLTAGLLANDGKFMMDFPLSTQDPSGLLRPFGVTPETRSVQFSARREMLPSLELFADLSFSDNRSTSIFNTWNNYFSVLAAAPTNPFTTDVLMRVPDATQLPVDTRSQVRSATIGALAQLPAGWTGALDLSASESRYDSLYYQLDTTARTAALTSGAINPFVDTLLYPIDLQPYVVPTAYKGANRLYDATLRGSGPLPSLPWGTPNLTVGIEHSIARTPARTYQTDFSQPISFNNSVVTTYYARDTVTDSGYMEALVPLIKSDWLPLLHALDLQLSGRVERYEMDTGTTSRSVYYRRTPPLVRYGGTVLSTTQPYFSKTSYNSKNYTVGLKYQPVEDVTLRVSRATAFLPPTASQLLINPLQSTNPTTVDDPRIPGNEATRPYTLGGGNPDLEPQHSTSLNAGVIWQPLERLRLNAEYYRIEQFDAIDSLQAQQIVNQEDSFPGRVTRDANGIITLVNISMVNLYHRETEGWDLSADYSFDTAMGRFNLRTVESIISHLKNQISQTLPELESAGYHLSEGGAAKYKTNMTLDWERRQWTLSWAARYTSSYKQVGAAGGPSSVQYGNGGVYGPDSYIIPQGSDTVSSQIYHDLFLGYDFGSRAAGGSALLQGVGVQFGVRNLFATVPPLDVYYGSNQYLSPYGDVRLRSWWLNLQKAF